ncbi:MAG: 5-formyltetrahydrofolate cyclo-ligase [Rhodospirillales bacterium]|nr:5-formyltetrahydrofolate cyclo-ligase [Rhodospirillales bacterium]
MPTDAAIAEDKRALRKRMRALRLVADQKQGPDAALGLIAAFMPHLDEFALTPDRIVAGFWPIITEIDVRPLLARIEARGIALALPVPAGADAPLLFRRWRPAEDRLVEGPHGTAHPPDSEPAVVPSVLFVPGLAFDGEGHRLGQGGGYYDRTLRSLRRQHAVTAIGVGYAVQRLPQVPHGEHDERMDWLLSEDALERVAG